MRGRPSKSPRLVVTTRLVLRRFSGLWGCRCSGAGQANVAVNSFCGDAIAAAANARRITAAPPFINNHIRYVGHHAAVDSARVEVGIYVGRQLQFDVAVDAAERNTILSDARQTDDDVAVDSFQRRATGGVRNANLSIDATRLNRTVDLTNYESTIHTLRVKRNLTRQLQRHSL